MAWHIHCDPGHVSRYVFCPGDHARARKIAENMQDVTLVSESRGYVMYSGTYEGIYMTTIGTGMGGPTAAIALEELAQMGADTFIRVGSCGVFQAGQKKGDVIIASGSYRTGGTADAYLPVNYPAVPTFAVLRQLVLSAEALDIPHTVGVGVSSDAFYVPPDEALEHIIKQTGIAFIEMESDTLFVLGALRRWRTGALFTSDGEPGVIKPEYGETDFRRGEQNAIQIALDAMLKIAQGDTQKTP